MKLRGQGGPSSPQGRGRGGGGVEEGGGGTHLADKADEGILGGSSAHAAEEQWWVRVVLRGTQCGLELGEQLRGSDRSPRVGP